MCAIKYQGLGGKLTNIDVQLLVRLTFELGSSERGNDRSANLNSSYK